MSKYYGFVVLSAWLNAAFLVVNRLVVADHSVSPLMFSCGSVLFGALCCLFYLSWVKPQGLWRAIDRRVWLWLILYGTVTGFVARLVLVYGQSVSSVTNAGFLSRLSPIFTVMLAYWFMKESLRFNRILYILLMIFGGYLVATKGQNSLQYLSIGDMMLVLFAAMLGFDQAMARKILTTGVPPLVATSMRYLMGAAAMLVAVGLTMPLEIIRWEPRLLASDVLLGSFLSGLFVFLTTLTRDIGLAHIKAGVVGALMLCSPVFSMVMGIALLQERVTMPQLLGSAIILMGSFMLSRKEVEKPRIRLFNFNRVILEQAR